MERIWGPHQRLLPRGLCGAVRDGGERYCSYAKVCWTRPDSYWDADCVFKLFGGEHHASRGSRDGVVGAEARTETSLLPRPHASWPSSRRATRCRCRACSSAPSFAIAWPEGAADFVAPHPQLRLRESFHWTSAGTAMTFMAMAETLPTYYDVLQVERDASPARARRLPQAGAEVPPGQDARQRECRPRHGGDQRRLRSAVRWPSPRGTRPVDPPRGAHEPPAAAAAPRAGRRCGPSCTRPPVGPGTCCSAPPWSRWAPLPLRSTSR